MQYSNLMLMLPFLLWPMSRSSDGSTAEVTRDPVVELCSTTNRAFKHGERVVYKIYYNWNFIWLSAGEVSFKATENEDEIFIEVVGKTYPSYEWFFAVDDYYSTKLDKDNLLPREFIRDVHEGSYTQYNKIVFDQEIGKAKSWKGKTKSQVAYKEYDLDGCMHDMLSMIYFLRNADIGNLRKGEAFPISIFMGDKTYDLSVAYKGNIKSKKVKGGDRFDLMHFSPEVLAGSQFSEGTTMDVYVTLDKNKVPIMVESPVSVGSVKAVLIEHSGLRHPLTAKK